MVKVKVLISWEKGHKRELSWGVLSQKAWDPGSLGAELVQNGLVLWFALDQFGVVTYIVKEEHLWGGFVL